MPRGMFYIIVAMHEKDCISLQSMLLSSQLVVVTECKFISNDERYSGHSWRQDHTFELRKNVVPELSYVRSLWGPPPSPSASYLSVFGRFQCYVCQ